MLALTKKTDYALIALCHLARMSDGVVSAREIAGSYGMPLPMLTNLLKTLNRAGIVFSERGAFGGYRLARPATSISLHELISAVEGPFQFVRCSEPSGVDNGGPCGLESCCPIRGPAHRIRRRLKQFLETITLAELMRKDEQAPAGALEFAITKNGLT